MAFLEYDTYSTTFHVSPHSFPTDFCVCIFIKLLYTFAHMFCTPCVIDYTKSTYNSHTVHRRLHILHNISHIFCDSVHIFHKQFTQHTSTHLPHIFHKYLPYVFKKPSIHLPLFLQPSIHLPYTMHRKCIFQTPSLHLSRTFHTSSIPVPHTFHGSSTHRPHALRESPPAFSILLPHTFQTPSTHIPYPSTHCPRTFHIPSTISHAFHAPSTHLPHTFQRVSASA